MSRLEAPEVAIVWGGSNGIGLEAVADFKQQGVPSVYIGATSPKSYAQALDFLQKRKKIDTSTGFFPLVADITKELQLFHAVREIRPLDKIGDKRKVVVFSQAGGMNGYLGQLFEKHIDSIVDNYTFETPIDELSEEKRQVVEEALTIMRSDLEVWTQEAQPEADAVNYQGTFHAIDVMANELNGGFDGIFYNSTWGHLSGTPGLEIPLLYRPIDQSKALVRDRLQREDQQLRNNGIHMTELVASLVNDTRVGKMFNDFLLNLTYKEQREAIRTSSIRARDVVAATRSIYQDDNTSRVVFVYREDGKPVISDKLNLSAMYTSPYLI